MSQTFHQRMSKVSKIKPLQWPTKLQLAVSIKASASSHDRKYTALTYVDFEVIKHLISAKETPQNTPQQWAVSSNKRSWTLGSWRWRCVLNFVTEKHAPPAHSAGCNCEIKPNDETKKHLCETKLNDSSAGSILTMFYCLWLVRGLTPLWDSLWISDTQAHQLACRQTHP